jgi:hypothetical protein
VWACSSEVPIAIKLLFRFQNIFAGLARRFPRLPKLAASQVRKGAAYASEAAIRHPVVWSDCTLCRRRWQCEDCG